MEFAINVGNLRSVIARESKLQPKMFDLHAWLTRVMAKEVAHDVPFTEGPALWLDSNVEQLTVHLFTVRAIEAQIDSGGA